MDAPFRTRSRPVLAVMATLLALAGCQPRQESPPEDGTAAPTVLLVTVDTLRADRLGCYGREDAGTPRIDRLAEGGTLFENAHTSAPLTLPAHASILTGRSLPAHGVFNNGTFRLPDGVPTLPEALAAAGWSTGAFVSAPVLARRYGLDRGFAVYDDHIPQPRSGRGLVVHYPERAGLETARRALAFIAAQPSGKPVFAWVHIWEPHVPYSPPADLARRYADDRYQGEVAAADRVVGRLIDEIDAMGRGDRRLVTVVADHGEGLGEHGEPTHGVFLYRATMRVPWILEGPAWGVPAGRRIEAPVSVIDLAPTLADLVGLPPLEGVDGASLVPLLRGGAAPDRAGVFAESHLPRLEFGWSGLRALVSAGHLKLIDAPRPELFDLEKDPSEEKDLSADRGADVRELQRGLDGLVARAGSLAPAGEAGREVSSEEIAELRSLGYAASGRHAGEGPLVDPRRPDPKDRQRFIAAFDEAVALAVGGKAAEAARRFAGLAETDPENPSLLLEWGQALILSGDHDRAIEVFRRLTSVDPEFSQAWYRLGQLLDERGDLDEAEAAYRRAAEVDPLAVEPRKALGSLLAQRGRVREAIDVLEQAKALDPRDPAIARELERLWARLR
ncbi:MAG: hypothetical protein Kow0062_20390 [Acidobacteriota bacterium]